MNTKETIYSSIKISELPSLESTLLKDCEVAAIAHNGSNLDNYKLKLSDYYLDANEINNKLSALKIELLRTIGAIEIPEEYDDTGLSILVEDYVKHLKALQNGALVDTSKETNGLIKEGSTLKLDDNETTLSKVDNILYRSLDASKVLISNENGKITTSEISPEELNYLRGITELGQKSLKDIINELKNELKNGLEEIKNFSSQFNIIPEYKEELILEKTFEETKHVYTVDRNCLLYVQPVYISNRDWTHYLEIYINGLLIGSVFSVYGDGYSQAATVLPLKKGYTVELVAKSGKAKKHISKLLY